ncbi:MAG: hypothetical protein M3008_10485 [Chloroflexota bacterium]|nr:hypothetical protein [Chloroflexota bacterium]
MADAAIFIGWGAPYPGRERKALEVFGEVMQYYGRLQQEGTIESFEPVALELHGGDLDGFALIRGEREKLARLRASDDFQRLNARAALVVSHFGVVDAHIGTGMQKLYAGFQEQIESLT